ncbi:hypothetical protein T03_11571 [Trichinella britovi]|uniref:Uncharacterized protein n=1 Tax=Trichinella britovi TaxID=45882 RepID=A0A0V1CSZ3_TRIBR|nr:hypothetical protein T03_11571 [Trichinella britovi]
MKLPVIRKGKFDCLTYSSAMLWVLSQFQFSKWHLFLLVLLENFPKCRTKIPFPLIATVASAGGGGALDLVKTFLTVVIRLISPLNNCNTDIRILLFTIE